MNEKEKKGEDKRTFSLSTLSVEKPPLLFGISLYAEHVFLYFIFIFFGFLSVLRWYCRGGARKWYLYGGPHH